MSRSRKNRIIKENQIKHKNLISEYYNKLQKIDRKEDIKRSNINRINNLVDILHKSMNNIAKNKLNHCDIDEYDKIYINNIFSDLYNRRLTIEFKFINYTIKDRVKEMIKSLDNTVYHDDTMYNFIIDDLLREKYNYIKPKCYYDDRIKSIILFISY